MALRFNLGKTRKHPHNSAWEEPTGPWHWACRLRNHLRQLLYHSYGGKHCTLLLTAQKWIIWQAHWMLDTQHRSSLSQDTKLISVWVSAKYMRRQLHNVRRLCIVYQDNLTNETYFIHVFMGSSCILWEVKQYVTCSYGLKLTLCFACLRSEVEVCVLGVCYRVRILLRRYVNLTRLIHQGLKTIQSCVWSCFPFLMLKVLWWKYAVTHIFTGVRLSIS